jgi:hypothetical protein
MKVVIRKDAISQMKQTPLARRALVQIIAATVAHTVKSPRRRTTTAVRMGMKLGVDVAVTKKRDHGLVPVIDSPLTNGVVVAVTKEITVPTATIIKVTTEAATDSNNSSRKDVVQTVTATSKKMASTGLNSPSL